jgi:hypothetical protein
MIHTAESNSKTCNYYDVNHKFNDPNVCYYLYVTKVHIH